MKILNIVFFENHFRMISEDAEKVVICRILKSTKRDFTLQLCSVEFCHHGN